MWRGPSFRTARTANLQGKMGVTVLECPARIDAGPDMDRRTLAL